MAFTNFYNTNANRAFPFQVGSVAVEGGPLSLRNLPDGVVVDAGFLLGPKSGAAADALVRLDRITRQGDFFIFEFGCNAPALFDAPLAFSRNLSDPDWQLQFVDSGGLGQSESGASDSFSHDGGPNDPCNDPLWSGYLVTGKMADLVLLLPMDGTVERLGDDAALIEPSLLQTLAGTAVTRIALANDDRTRVDPPDGCPDNRPDVDPIHIAARCMVGDIAFYAGYNAQIRQDDNSNALVFGAAVGAGQGQPCTEVPLFIGETPPDGSDLLEGGPTCNEVLRSINGVGGPMMPILAGPGVTVTSLPEMNTIIVDVNLAGTPLVIVVAESTSCS